MENKYMVNDEVQVLSALKNNNGYGIVQTVPKTEGDKYLIAMNRSYALVYESDLKKWVHNAT